MSFLKKNNIYNPLLIKIYNVRKYKGYKFLKECDLETLVNLIETNKKGYHELLLSINKIKFVMDIDDKDNECAPPINEIMSDLCIFLNNKEIDITIKDVKLTKNISKPSYHLTIPKLNATSGKLKFLMIEFKKTYPNYSKYIDVSIYVKSKLFRLPNQLKNNVDGTQHILINDSKITDFIINYIDEDSINIDDKITEVEEIKEKKKKYKKYDTVIKDKLDNNNVYIFTEEYAKELLDNLPTEFLDDFNLWLKISTILKYHGLKKLWDEWSSANPIKYDKIENDIIYDNISSQCDINYIILILNNKGHKYEKIKKYKKIDDDYKNKNTIEINYKYFDIDIDKIIKYQDIIIKASCGTGKTTYVSKLTERLKKDNQELKIMTIITHKSLINQHHDSFTKNKIELLNYSKDKDLINNDFTICINSLCKIKDISDEELSKYIIFIDEIDSFISNLVNNSTLTELSNIMELLLRIIDNSYKCIYASAHVKSNLEYLLNKKKTSVFIINNFKNFKNTKAFEIKEMANKIYKDCSSVLEDKNKIVLITSETDIEVENPSENFKNKIIMHTPKIIFGVNYSVDEAQDVYVYCGGNSIGVYQIFQQVCRTRNIRNVYYYFENKKNTLKYETLEETREIYKSRIKQNEILTSLCSVSIDRMKKTMIENEYFNLFCYEKYYNNIYRTDMKKYFELIMEDSGFEIIPDTRIEKKLEPILNKKLKNLIAVDEELLIAEYINGNKNIREKKEYKQIHERAKVLKIDEIQNIDIYKEILKTEKEMYLHQNLIRLFKTDKYINERLNKIYDTSLNVKVIDNVYNKITLLRKIEKDNNINMLDVDFCEDGDVVMDLETHKLLQYVFKTKKKKPENKRELKIFYVAMLKHLCGNFINSLKVDKIINKKRKKTTKYFLNIDKIKLSLKLDKYCNPERKNFNDIVNNYIQIFEK